MTQTVVERLRAILPGAGLIAGQADMAPYLTDWRGQVEGRGLCVALPTTTDEVAAVVRTCVTAGIPIVPHGGNTGLCAGATPDPQRPGVVLGLARMNRIRSIDRAANAMTVEAGCPLAAVQEAATGADRLFPLSMGSEGSCQIGGMVSTNAGGTAVLRYGNVRDLILGLEVVLPNGDVWDGLRTLRKDNTGYDLKQLFIGAEGTLGVVTAVALKMFPRPRDWAQAWIGLHSPEQATSLFGSLQERFDTRVTAFEMLSEAQVAKAVAYLPQARRPVAGPHRWHVLVELTDAQPAAGLVERLTEALAEAAEAGGVEAAAVAQSQAQADDFWRIRHCVSDANKADGVSVTADIAVPTSAVPGFLADADSEVERHFPEAEVLVVSHVGDGNVHYIVQYAWERWRALGDPDATRSEILARVHDLAINHHGTFSAEHGIGQKLKDELARYKSPVELRMFRLVKQAFDPEGLMNPGKLLPD